MTIHSIISETLQRVLLRGTLGLEDFMRLRENAMPIGIALAERRGIVHADAVWRETGNSLSYFALTPSALAELRREIEAGEISDADVLAAFRSPPVQAWLSLHQFHHCYQCGHLKVHSVCEHCWEAAQPRLGVVHVGSLRSQLGSEICIDEICMETPDPVNVMPYEPV